MLVGSSHFQAFGAQLGPTSFDEGNPASRRQRRRKACGTFAGHGRDKLCFVVLCCNGLPA